MKRNNLWYCLVLLSAPMAAAAEYHVSVRGDDAHDGSAQRPLRTIQRAAELAQSRDTITVHEGVYRERVNPPRGDTSDDRRIVYQATPGQHGAHCVRHFCRGGKVHRA